MYPALKAKCLTDVKPVPGVDTTAGRGYHHLWAAIPFLREGENMPTIMAPSPPEVARFSGLYRFISPDRFEELGIDPEDVPLGTFPAEDHPPFLPDRFGGNAYGLGLFEQVVLPASEASLLESLDLGDPDQVARHHRTLNDIFKRLGLLIRFTRTGRPFYLIPRQFVAHFLVEVQALTDEIVSFLENLLSRRLAETLRVGLLAEDHELILPELQSRMPHLEFQVLESLHERESGDPLSAVVMVGDPVSFGLGSSPGEGSNGLEHRRREAYGYFVAGRLWDLLEDEGELIVFADRPLEGSRRNLTVRFASQGELKRFLLFSHVYRTYRRYRSGADTTLTVNRFDFEAFLAGLGLYHETAQGLLDGRNLARVSPQEIDRLPHQDLPLPRGSARRTLAAWQRWFGPFFYLRRQDSILPELQRREWEARYQIDGDFPDTFLVLQGVKRRPPVTLAQLESRLGRQRLAGCDRRLLAAYKDSFTYVRQVLDILEQIRQGRLEGMPGLELSRLRKPFESAQRHPQLADVLRLMELAPRLAQMEERLNPEGRLGPRTAVLANLEKLALMGLAEGPLMQLYLIVLGHSTMTRVTFGKLPETTLQPLTDLGRYTSLEEAVSLLRLYRLLSVAEAAAASAGGLTGRQVQELFALYDDAIRVVTDPRTTWEELLNARITHLGGVQAQATRRMLKLFNLFEFLDTWRELEAAGPRRKEAMADYQPDKLARLEEVVELCQLVRRFVGRFYPEGTTARPYFFRALLTCELHGSGRLLPHLGATAGFTLLWILVHASERRILNLNPLVEADSIAERQARLAMLREALLSLPLEELAPQRLARLRQQMARQGEAYLGDTGLYLVEDAATGALIPRFVDADGELARLEGDVARTLEEDLAAVPDARLAAMDRRLHEVGRFLAAQGRSRDPRLAQMRRRRSRLVRRLESYLWSQLFHLPTFAANLERLVTHCPHLMARLLPHPVDSPHTARRLAAAHKLSALHHRRLELFQDMQQSHEMARAEFGPTAAGIVGVSPLQFQELTASLAQLVAGQPRLERLLMLALLFYAPEDLPPVAGRARLAAVCARFNLGRHDRQHLAFLLEHHDRFRQVVCGEACLLGLKEVVERRDPPLTEALFLLSVITTAARREGLLSEDLLERFYELLRQVRELLHTRGTALQAQQHLLEEQARRNLAFEHYCEIQRGEAPTASLRHLLDTTRLPHRDRQELLRQGVLRAGLNRLLRLRQLWYIDWLDLMLLHQSVPVVYIYRLKGLRSMGPTHFERDLYEALRFYRGLETLPPGVKDYLLTALVDQDHPLYISGYSAAVGRLTYANQVRLLLLGLAAVRELDLQPQPRHLSFQPLARVMDRKFEMVNEAVTRLRPEILVHNRGLLKNLLTAREGLRLDWDPQRAILSLDIADPLRLGRKIEAVRRARTVGKLKRIYHRELKRLKLTHYHTLDYGQRLEAAFQENLARLGEEMVEKVRRRMARVTRPDRLEAIFLRAWEEGLELPLSPERQQTLRDLYEMNLERLRARLLAQIVSRLQQVDTPTALEELWEEVKQRLHQQRRYLGKDFELVVAERFDRRAVQLSHGARA